LYALEAETGSEIWTFATEGAIWGQPTYHEGIIYLTSLDKHVYALDAESGQEIWRTELDGAISAQAILNVDENLLYVGAYDNAMHALDAETGQEKWQAAATNWIWNAPALAEDTLYYADSSSQVFAVDAVTGAEKWSTSVVDMNEVEGVLLQIAERIEGAIQASPVYNDGVLYIASEGNRETKEGLLIAMDAETGTEIWQKTTNQPLYSTPVIADDAIIVAMNSDVITMIAYSLESGDQKWSYQPNRESNQE
jgi:outer membrane protein assembly factor BamB